MSSTAVLMYSGLAVWLLSLAVQGDFSFHKMRIGQLYGSFKAGRRFKPIAMTLTCISLVLFLAALVTLFV